ncbi:MAG: ABC transporter ATP-binding protein [Planctomycetota bacterium]|nr:ABC transporter ATP-binding protein [Planctomycetota bacterium]
MSTQKNQGHSFQEDFKVGKAFDRGLMGRLLRYALPHKHLIILALLLLFTVTLGSLVGPFIIQRAIDGPLKDSILGSSPDAGSAFREILVLLSVFLGVSLLLLVLRFAQSLVMAHIGQRVVFDLRQQIYTHLLKMPLSFYDRNPVGRLVTRITSDIEALNELFASGIVGFLADVLILTAITATLLWVNPVLALVTLSALPVLILSTFIFRNKARKYYRQQRGHLSHLNSFTQEAIQGMEIVQAFHREASHQEEHRTVNRSYLVAFLRSVMAYAVFFPVIEILSTVVLAAVIWQGGSQLIEGTLSFGQFYLFWHFLGRFFQPIRDMADRYNILQSAMAAAERVFNVLDTPESLTDPEQPCPGGKLQGRIDFDKVWFAYKDEEFVLKDVSFSVEPGQTVAIVGATGSGKTTIVNLLSRFYDPQRGAILVDETDVRHYRKQDLRARIGSVLQDVFLFSRSIRDNLVLNATDVSEEHLLDCARRANADDFVSRLPGAYDEILSERGGTLSVGEKQLLVFARARVQDPDILILDEATAYIDSTTEALIQDAIGKLLEGRTSIVIAHRLSTIKKADRILVLHKGELREQGTHEELLAVKGIYHRLHELQYLDSAAAPDSIG